MQRRFLFAGLLAALILVTAVIFRLSEQPAVSGAVSDDSLVDVPEAESSRPQSAGGVAQFDSPSSSMREINGVEATVDERFDEQSVGDALSDSVFPELGLPPDIGMHEQAAAFASEGRDSWISCRWRASVSPIGDPPPSSASSIGFPCE